MTTPTPADWYPDPEDASSLRYWDGTTWTEHRAPAVAPEAPAVEATAEPEAPTPGAHRAPDAGTAPPVYPTPAYEPSTAAYEPPPAYEQPAASGSKTKLFAILGAVAAIVLVAALVLVYFFVIKDDDTKTASGTTSSSKTSASSSKSTTSKSKSTPKPTAPAGGQTIDEYAAANGITVTVATPGQDGAIPITIPTPDGWATTTADLPEGSYVALTDTASGVDPSESPTVYADLVKLTGTNVDTPAIFALAPNELLNYNGYEPVSDGAETDLGGFQAYELAGTYLYEGTKLFIAQKTVIIPAGDGVYVLRLYGYSQPTQDQEARLGAGLDAINSGTTIG